MRKLCILLGCSLIFSCTTIEVRKQYYSNGKLKTEEYYKNGKLNGWTKEYSINGTLLKKDHWVNGLKDTVQYFQKDSIDVWFVCGEDGKRKESYLRFPSEKLTPTHNNVIWFPRVYKQRDTAYLGDSLTIHVVLFAGRLDSIFHCKVIIGKADTITHDITEIHLNIPMPPDNTLRYTFIPNHLGVDTLDGEVMVNQIGRSVARLYPFRFVYYVKSK